MVFDSRIQRRMRDRRIVHFAVSVSTIADQIDDHVALERAAVLCRELSCADDSRDVLSVDMKNRNRQPLRHISRKPCGMELGWVGGEPNQVVHDDVNRSADRRNPSRSARLSVSATIP